MSDILIYEIIDMLPDNEKALAYELIKRLVLAWDPDFTKVTPSEGADLTTATEEYQRGEYITDADIDWN